jgi:hypothetical protein
MSRSVPKPKCPDCSDVLVAIKLVSRGWGGVASGAVVDSEVIYYADKSAKRSTWMGRFEEAGTVQTTMCRGCRRIFLHAEPKSSKT